MTITLQAVNEIIASLESAGELSIKETKVMALAKAYQQLAAENVALKGLARGWANATDDRLFEEFGEISHDSIDDCEAELKIICPATDRIVAEAEARGIEKGIAHLEKKFSNIGVQIMNLQWLADSLREGADKC
ncbi:hypothetical protein [Klebsiella pneumoniae]|uniref:hypothetical protein n=1 Tax=Klebsiella pneumoniae TaxID=573 RepID=UPI000B42134A|nr:hypothetical protein [Klebsiella pneumoniae]MCD5777462.1 hypothetical protein [Klebsiella pneumoniae]OVX74660.1 hypothetical protein BME25_00060 [Klebsiella pneumoniae]HBT0141591.1 hypothetical protein [Klebsiella pneumoniae]HBT3831775.1 hypothetical protein [Klebsiella pneumoniae]HCJ1427022.1 hypothetical protein [Klebsiella pneumoniae]